METHYTILEIQDTATPEEIKDSYRLLLQVWHPDRFHHRPALLAKAEEKSRKINVAFETLSDPVLKQRYDDWLRASGGWRTKAVESVTCPSCHTTIRPAHEHSEGWEAYERRRRATEERNRTAGATGQGNPPFPRAKTAMLAIGALFTIVIVFVLTKPSKTLISNKAPQTVAQETLPGNETVTVDETEPDHHARTVREDISNSPTLADKLPGPSRNTPSTTPQQEGRDRLALTQRLMAKTPVRVQPPPAEMVSAVDQQQLMRLATQGYASAQNQLGELYANGRGAPQDYPTARKWYTKAAAQGHGWAQNQLGQLSADGLGVPQDYKQAHHWWEQAATQGVAQAQYNLGQLYATGRGIPQNYSTARGWYEKAAAQGHTWAQAQLGQLYVNGQGVPKDYAAARKWYEKAAAQGNAWAQAQLAML